MDLVDFCGMAAMYGYQREPDTITDRLIIVRADSQSILLSFRKEAIERATNEQAVVLLKAAANFGSNWRTRSSLPPFTGELEGGLVDSGSTINLEDNNDAIF